MHNYNIITGGPGSGKSSLIYALEQRSFKCMPEAGRAIIQDQMRIGGSALPWADRSAFAELMLSWEMRSYREAPDTGQPVFFDRAIPDVMGYLELCKLPVPEHVERAVAEFRYQRQVFIAPPWPEIFQTDSERRQSLAEAAATFDAMVSIYTRLDYELLILPRSSLPDRVEFVLAAL